MPGGVPQAAIALEAAAERELLTDAEQRAMDLTADLMKLLSSKIISSGPTRSQDLNEAALRIHAIQHMIMSQAAARAYPDTYRLLGDPSPEGAPS